MKTAFASCYDPIDDNKQIVWDEVQRHSPSILILLGDNVYMDYGLGKNFRNGKPRELPHDKFAKELYRRYLAQSKVKSFTGLVRSVSYVLTIWDDHDFAWNNSCGGAVEGGKGDVPVEKRKISRSLHLQFRGWLNSGSLDTYPAMPSMNEMLSQPDTGIEYHKDIGGILFIMSDGRYYRQRMNKSISFLGDKQKAWLEGLLKDELKVKVFCTSTPLREGKEAWKKYSDLKWLKNFSMSKTVILSGDIHKNNLSVHRDIDNVTEATSSGAARPPDFLFLGESGNFGILDIDDTYADIRLYKTKKKGKTRLEYNKRISF